MIKKCRIFILSLFLSFFAYNAHAFDSKNNISFISEVKTGIAAHDVGFFGRQKEDGLVSSFEFLFREINYNLLWLGTPRPHIGANINMSGNTSQAYAGVTWGYKLPKRMFFNFSWGLSYHNGDKKHSDNIKIYGDNKKLLKIGWKPKYTSLTSIVDEIIS